jgi:hypothetical protein
MKPVLIVNPITGLQCYTKHPEKLIERSRRIKPAVERIETIIDKIRVIDRWGFPHTQWLSGEVRIDD